LGQWRESFRFWGLSKDNGAVSKNYTVPDIERILKGDILFFSTQWISLGSDYDWITNPDSGHRYDPDAHWSDIQDYSRQAGDIKFVWEKSRFSYLYDVMRYDLATKEDHAEWVFKEIAFWLKANKINSGPNYKCSQEISLRILNWTYALNFYKNSPYLTECLFQDIINAIYWQLKHVYDNINFSRIAVRNNHAITETLTLYMMAMFYPFFPEAGKWKKEGKKWFEQEVAYQIYPDGTFLQFSMNYHRVVVQLLTWALKTADYFGERFSQLVYDRAYRSVDFLYTCQDEGTGWLPNYGSNDGALFFRMNNCDYRDYRPQLNALHMLLTGKPLYGTGGWEEDISWFEMKKIKQTGYGTLSHIAGWKTFEVGGYFVLREKETLTFIRCGKHKDRPAQADNLHIDIWHKGQNIVFDAGSYKYNTDFKTLKYFMGTESHNTVMLNHLDQMLKGARFIWFNWSQAIKAEVNEDEDSYYFNGAISAFRELSRGIVHTRCLMKLKAKPQWVIKDQISGKPTGVKVRQLWHVSPNIMMWSREDEGEEIQHRTEKGMKSDYYGIKEESLQRVVETEKEAIITTITLP